MKTILLIALSLISFYSFSQLHSKPPCDCEDDYKPVHTKNGKNYLNECIAKCLTSKKLYKGNADSSQIKVRDTLTWPINEVCSPLYGPTSVVFAKKENSGKIVPDGTLIFNPNSKYHRRGVVKKPCNLRCLPPNTAIKTPNGGTQIKLLNIGDTVLSINNKKEIIEVPIISKDSVNVSINHKVLKIALADGRELQVTPEHPDANYYQLIKHKIGEFLDGSAIIGMEIVDYRYEYTYDILPKSSSGVYWANDIKIGSTLFYSNTAKK